MFTARRMQSLAALALLVAGLIAASPRISEAGKTPRPPRHFHLVYCWGVDSFDDVVEEWCVPAELTLYANGRFDAYDGATDTTSTNVGDWYTTRKNRTITFEIDNGTIYTGDKQSDGSYRGTIIGYLGSTGLWMGEFVD
ncbi:MAG: hypothetical protein U0840_14130 [Gemmataceae bacterium]